MDLNMALTLCGYARRLAIPEQCFDFEINCLSDRNRMAAREVETSF